MPPPRIRLLVLDVDGVLTDGRLYFGPRGEALKVFHVRDGTGIMLLQRAGVTVAVISGRRSPMLVVRCRELGVRHVHQGVADKLGGLRAAVRAAAADAGGVRLRRRRPAGPAADARRGPVVRGRGRASARCAAPRDIVTRRAAARRGARGVRSPAGAPRAASARQR